ncbi:MAG: (E)-4-hydroxy-3-methylbut-2-enyl-diphosphate synthase [Verrucomicrobia bacterium]|nr:(E)-4-hydroxy-3-methylbut-2-enyl-diphosphate synthase [Verrucomicrobiota bacterium]
MISLPYALSRFQTVRRRTREVKIGPVGVGGANPLRIQSMTTSDTQDVAATVRQAIALAEVGCEIVRITAPNVQAARALRPIREQFAAAGFANVPLVADIHFLPSAAMEAVEHVEKIRINPGNYADKKKFAVLDYTDAAYDAELARIHEAVTPLILRCKALGRAVRIGTNHGSLSDRIMNRYGDTPLGMVESALEFLRICRGHGFHDIVLSMKASNPKVMIQAYRLLVARMDQEGMDYPLHLGVTEAGDGEDGRIKSAIGIGSLLADGLGDTLRVSLTEDSVYEIPVAQALARKAMAGWVVDTEDLKNGAKAPTTDAIDPYVYTKRPVMPLELGSAFSVGPELPPRVVTRVSSVAALAEAGKAFAASRLIDTPVEGVLVPINSAADLAALRAATFPAGATPFLELASELTPADLAGVNASSPVVWVRVFAANAYDAETLAGLAKLARARGHALAVATTAEALSAPDSPLAATLRQLGDTGLIITLDAASPDSQGRHPVGRYRALAEAWRGLGGRTPLWIRNTTATQIAPAPDFLSRLLDGSVLTGTLLCDGLGDLVSIETEPDPVRALKLSYNVLQGAGTRSSKTEFVACPSCGRTLFDLQTTTQRIRARTGHLKGVKIAIMGCIVNGPGEMADADFGYVGGAPAKINLYVGKQCVQYNIPQAEADDRLVALIKEHGKWVEPRSS